MVDLSKLRVLVAEDNPLNQQVFVRLLRILGCQVDFATDGRQAVDIASQGTYDLILMDIRMPDMSGLEATAEIRQREKDDDRARIPIVAITGHSSKQECLDVGMDDFLRKPITLSNLQGLIQRWCEPDEGPAEGKSPQ